MPRLAPEALNGIAARAIQGCIAFSAEAGKPLRKTPLKVFGAQDNRGIGVSFLLDTFLSTAWMQEIEQRMEQLPRTSKEKYPARRCGNRH